MKVNIFKKILILAIILILSGCSQPVTNEIIEENLGAAGDLTFGTAQELTSDETHGISIVKMDSLKLMACYYNADSADTECRAGTVSETTITYGSIQNISTSAIGGDTCVAKMETDKAMVLWMGNNTYMNGQIATTSGTAVNTNNSDLNNDLLNGVVNNTTGNEFCDDLGNNKFVVAADAGSNADAVVGTVPAGETGSAITIGTEKSYESGDTNYTTLCKYSSTDERWAVFYEDQGNSDIGKTVVATSTGTTINHITTPVTYSDEADNDIFAYCEYLSDNLVAVAWHEQSGTSLETRIIQTDSEGSLTKGTQLNVDGDARNIAVARHDAAHYVIAYSDDADSDKGKAVYCTVSGTTVSCGTPTTFANKDIGGDGADYGLDVEFVDTNKFVICYQDDSAVDDPSECIIGDVEVAAPAETATSTPQSVIWF